MILFEILLMMFLIIFLFLQKIVGLLHSLDFIQVLLKMIQDLTLSAVNCKNTGNKKFLKQILDILVQVCFEHLWGCYSIILTHSSYNLFLYKTCLFSTFVKLRLAVILVFVLLIWYLGVNFDVFFC